MYRIVFIRTHFVCARCDWYHRSGNLYAKLAYTGNRPTRIQYSLQYLLLPQIPLSADNDESEEDARQYLGVTTFTSARIDPSHSQIRALVGQILAGYVRTGDPARDVREAAKRIAVFVASIPYEVPPPGWGWPTLDQYLRDYRYMECGGHALMFCCLARAAGSFDLTLILLTTPSTILLGIPARRVFWPFASPSTAAPQTLSFGSHMIAEFFDVSIRQWFPVDATSGPFDVHNRGHWGKLPWGGGGVPVGMLLYVESMTGEESKSSNFVPTGSMRNATISILEG